MSAAEKKIKELMQESGYDSSYFLKVEVVGGGCSGLKLRV
jgi:Fe-S cluster assembly iron-binding protein IscA